MQSIDRNHGRLREQLCMCLFASPYEGHSSVECHVHAG
jgi:hypothetical protein